jgi:hypothetical protein
MLSQFSAILTIKNTFILLFAFCLYHRSLAQSQPKTETQKFLDSLNMVFAQKFSNASNSNNFKIINDSDLKLLKNNIINKFNQQNQELASLTNELKYRIDSIQHLKEMSELLILENKALKQPDPKAYLFNLRLDTVIYAGIIFVLALIIGYQLLFFLKYRKECRESREIYHTIDRDFESYKKNTIERERKLLREIIDLKKKLSE